MHALEWITAEPRYYRSLSATRLQAILERQPKHCTWCNKPVPKPRRSWCSDTCISDFLGRCDPQHIGQHVKARDRGVCAICGTDTKEAQRLLRSIKELAYACHPRNSRGWKCSCGLCRTIEEHKDLSTWQADHIIPVIEGGGLCDLNGYRTLCVACHKAETKTLAARRRKST